MPYEDRKEEITAEDENNEGTKVGLRLDENGQVIIEATDLYNWSCPNCTHIKIPYQIT